MRGDAEAAIVDLCRAIALDPAYRDAYHNRGLAYAEIGKLDEAIVDLTQAIALAPAFWSAYRHRGIVHAMRGERPGQLPGLPENQGISRRRITADRLTHASRSHSSCLEVGNLSGMLRRIPTHAGQGSPRRPLLSSVRYYWLLQLCRGECGDAFDCPLVGGVDIAKQHGTLNAEGRHLGRRIAQPCAFPWHPIPLGPACTYPDLWFATDGGADKILQRLRCHTSQAMELLSAVG